MKQLEVNRRLFTDFRVAEHASTPLNDGDIRVDIDFFAFTANNMTYAAAGDMLGYWQFFPVPGDDAYGVIPVWGFANVVESRHSEVEVGERLFGYFPPADELVMHPINLSEHSLFDGSEHRQALPPLYNRYQRARAGNAASVEQLQALLGPLYNTSYCLWDQLSENRFYGAEQIVILSASSKTSIGLAMALADDEQAPSIVGVTSTANATFVADLGYYDASVNYNAIETIAHVPTAVVDMAGNAQTANALATHLGDALKHFISVGLTHWDQAGEGLSGESDRREFFFAPSYILERSKALPAGEFQRRAQSFVMEAAARSGQWLTLEQADGIAALSERYSDICAGKMDPKTGLICQL